MEMIPSTSKDKILVLNSAGNLYASRERISTVFDSIKMKQSKVNELYDQIKAEISSDTHC